MNETDIKPPQIGTLALYALVSSSVLDGSNQQDYYTGLLPFFEDFIRRYDQKFFDKDALSAYADEFLMLPLTDEVIEIFVDRMIKVGWLIRLPSKADKSILKCFYRGNAFDDTQVADVSKQLDELRSSLVDYLKLRKVYNKIFVGKNIDEIFLTFLTHQTTNEDCILSLDDGEDGNALSKSHAYWMAKFIKHVSKYDLQIFAFIEKLSGVTLLAEALLELRNPSANPSDGTNLIVYLDAPLLMNHMGLGGPVQKENIDFVLQRLQKAGAKLVCLRYACEEIRDVLYAMLDSPIVQRFGLTWEAIKRGEITETFVKGVMNNPEHFVKKLTDIAIIPGSLSQYSSASRFCNDSVVAEIIQEMRAQGLASRERDGYSLGIIMRRRAGKESSSLYGSGYLFLTGNAAIVRKCNQILRDNGLQSRDRTVIGPALHHRMIAGFLFANAGVDDKREVSRRQLLAACSQVLLARPKVLRDLKMQIGFLNDQNSKQITEALLTQPRATEILMDFTVGENRTLSRSNVEQLVEQLSSAASKEDKEKHAHELWEQRKEYTSTIESLKKKLHDSEIAKSFENEQKQTIAVKKQQLILLTAQDVLARIKTKERFFLFFLWFLLTILIAAPSIYTGYWPLMAAVLIISLLSGAALALQIFNRNVYYVENYFQKLFERELKRKFEALDLSEEFNNLHLDYRKGEVSPRN